MPGGSLRPLGIVGAFCRLMEIPQCLRRSRAGLAGVGGGDSSSLKSTTSTLIFLGFGAGGRLAGSTLTEVGAELLGPGGRIGPPGRGPLGAPRTPGGAPLGAPRTPGGAPLGAPRIPGGGPLIPGAPRPIGILGLIPLMRGPPGAPLIRGPPGAPLMRDPPGAPRILTPPRPRIGGEIILAPGAPRGGPPPRGGAPPLTPGGPAPLTGLGPWGPVALTGLIPLPLTGLAPMFGLTGLPPLPAGDVNLAGDVSLTPIPEVPATGLPALGGVPTMIGGGVPLAPPITWPIAVDVMREEGLTSRTMLTMVVVGACRRLLRG